MCLAAIVVVVWSFSTSSTNRTAVFVEPTPKQPQHPSPSPPSTKTAVRIFWLLLLPSEVGLAGRQSLPLTPSRSHHITHTHTTPPRPPTITMPTSPAFFLLPQTPPSDFLDCGKNSDERKKQLFFVILVSSRCRLFSFLFFLLILCGLSSSVSSFSFFLYVNVLLFLSSQFSYHFVLVLKKKIFQKICSLI